jgi:hypothetical protein
MNTAFLRRLFGAAVLCLSIALLSSPASAITLSHRAELKPAADRLRCHETCSGFASAQPAPPAQSPQPASGIEKQALAFAADNGVSVQIAKGKLFFKLKAGKEIALFTTDASADGLKSAQTQLSALVDKKMSELTSTFGVKFSEADEVVDKQWVKNEKDEWVRGVEVKARLPHLNELYGIEAALYRAQPSHKARAPSKDALKFYFLTDDLTKGERPLATYSSSRNGGPGICFYMGSTAGRVVIERDAKFDPTLSMGHGYASIEALTLHEISHNHQHVMDWWTSVEKDVAEEFGFVKAGDGWAIKAKDKDKSGAHLLYRRREKDHKWYRCDGDGKPIDGQPELTGSEMRKVALNRPMTYYFPTPSETYAEGLMIYRLGGVYRASLLK